MADTAVTTEKEKPDYRAINKKDAPEAAFPAPMSGEYRVHITEDAYTKMKVHAAQTNEVELCGVLIGNVRRDAQGAFLQITAVIEGKGANNYGAQVTFTHQTWEHINTIKDRDYGKDRIVGWYHTHPGFGIFLSSMDVFIQENYFNHPYQVAIVIETKQNQEGCFAWVDGKSTPLTRYWVGNTETKLTTGSTSEFAVNETPHAANPAHPEMARASMPYQPQPEPSRTGELMTSMLLTVLAFLCGLFFGKWSMREQFKAEELSAVQDEMYSLIEFASLATAARTDLTKLNERLVEANQKLQAGDSTAAGKTLGEVQANLDALLKAYSKRRDDIRNDFTQMENAKRSMGQRVDNTTLATAMLYAMRAQDMVPRENGNFDVSKLSEQQLMVVRGFVQIAMELTPEVKSRMDPRFIEALTAEKKEAPKAETPKPEAPPKTNGK